MKRQYVKSTALLVGLLVAAVIGFAWDDGYSQGPKYPTKPLRLIVPYGAGGGLDVTARTTAPFLEKELGQPVAVVNMPGAGGVIGLTAISKAKADGYTLGIITMPALASNYIAGNLTIDPLKAFKFLGTIAVDPTTICVSTKSKFKDIKGMVEYLKANPEGVSYAATGVIGLDGLSILSLEKVANVKTRIVNFEGGKEAITAVMGGHVDAVGLAVGEALEYVKSNDLRILAVAGPTRDPKIPDVPTFKEQGFDLAVNAAIRGYVVPGQTNDKIVATLRAAVKKVAMNQNFIDAGKKVALPVKYMSAEELSALVSQQIISLKDIVPKTVK